MADRAAKRSNDAGGPATAGGNRLRTVAGYFADSQTGDSDRLVYEKIRLGILSALSVVPSLSFAELRDLLHTSDGNLSAHARKLEEAGYIACEKTFTNRIPRSVYRLTPQGKRVFTRHLEHMESLIRATQGK